MVASLFDTDTDGDTDPERRRFSGAEHKTGQETSMTTEYRITMTATFDKLENRDAVAARMKEIVSSEKANFPEGSGWKRAELRTDEYQIAETPQIEVL